MTHQGCFLRGVSKLNLFLAIITLLIFPIASLGTRFMLWSYSGAITSLRYEVYLGIIVIVLSVLVLIIGLSRHTKGTTGKSLLSLILALIVVIPIWNQYRIARTVPPINDITTDTVNPPQFVYPIPDRDPISSPLTYPGEVFATQQLSAYPEITSIQTSMQPVQAFARALEIVEANGWDVIEADQAQGIIEATDTSFWFGFKDDIVIRITATMTGSLIDLRSVSRVGVSDLGVNAKRIEGFIQAFEQN